MLHYFCLLRGEVWHRQAPRAVPHLGARRLTQQSLPMPAILLLTPQRDSGLPSPPTPAHIAFPVCFVFPKRWTSATVEKEEDLQPSQLGRPFSHAGKGGLWLGENRITFASGLRRKCPDTSLVVIPAGQLDDARLQRLVRGDGISGRPDAACLPRAVSSSHHACVAA